MNLKKRLKFKDEEVAYTENDRQFYQTLVAEAEISSQPQSSVIAKSRKRVLAFIIPLAAVILCIAVTLICVFTLKDNNSLPLYSDVNVKAKEATFVEMYDDVKSFDLISLENMTTNISLFYDSSSNDNLYYSCKIENEMSSGNFTFVINKNYDFKFDMAVNSKTEVLTNYSITYSSVDNPADAIPSTNYKGWIKVESETVFFEYKQVPASGDDAFFESIQQLIQVK